jgi:hypothetical protein
MRYIIPIFVLVFLVGCVKRDSIRYVTLPAKPIEQVELLPGPPTKPFKVVGHVFVTGAPAASWQSVAEGARAEAAEIGADAVFMGVAGQYQAGTVIIPGSSTTTTTGTITGSSINMTSNTFGGASIAAGIQRKRFTGIAIVYQQP